MGSLLSEADPTCLDRPSIKELRYRLEAHWRNPNRKRRKIRRGHGARAYARFGAVRLRGHRERR